MERLEAFILSILDTDLCIKKNLALIFETRFRAIVDNLRSALFDMTIRNNKVQVMLSMCSDGSGSKITKITINSYRIELYRDMFHGGYYVEMYRHKNDEPMYITDTITHHKYDSYEEFRPVSGSMCLADCMKFSVKSSSK